MEFTPAQIHLALNHFVIAGPFFSALLIAWGFYRRSVEVRRMGFLILLLSALIAIPVFLSGRSAEHQVEHLTGVSELWLGEHEEAGTGAFVVLLVAGIMSLLGSLLRRFQRVALARIVEWGAFLVTLAFIIAVVRAAHFGGMIRHPELEPGTFIEDSE